MRIIGYLEYPGIKTTVFQMDNRLSVKFETGSYEQIYKFRTGEGADTLEDLKTLLDESFITRVLLGFQQMHETRLNRMATLQGTRAETFEEIL